MTSKLIQQSRGAREVEIFPAFPPRDDMQNFNHLYRPAYPSALHRHLGLDNSILVLCEAPLRWAPGQRRGHRIPDLTVAFGADHALALYQQGYSIQDQGKPRTSCWKWPPPAPPRRITSISGWTTLTSE